MNNKGKIDSTTAILIIVVIIALSSTGMLAGLRDAGQGFNFDWLTGGGVSSGLVDVNKQLDLALVNKYSGAPLGSKTLKVWDPAISAFKESALTTASDGTITTAYPYESGKQLYVYYEASNDKQWFSFTVPQMNPSDAESATYNIIPLESFTVGTYSTDALKYANGTSIADAGTHNVTTSGTTPKWTYSLANTGSDNTGMIASYDPSYNMRFDTVVYMTLSGTGYESVLVYGDFDADYTLGSTHILSRTLDPYGLTKHKTGWEYKSHGTQDIGFWMDLSGIASGDSVTWQIYVYAYSDPTYAMNHGGDYGYEKVELAEHTVTINIVA